MIKIKIWELFAANVARVLAISILLHSKHYRSSVNYRGTSSKESCDFYVLKWLERILLENTAWGVRGSGPAVGEKFDYAKIIVFMINQCNAH